MRRTRIVSFVFTKKSRLLRTVCIVDEQIADAVLYGSEATQSRVFTVGFIGTAFYANTEAAQYISQHIAPAFIDDRQIQL
jgi:hypothetical protein